MTDYRRIITFVLSFISIHFSDYNCYSQNIAAENSFEKKAYQLATSWHSGDSDACRQFAELLLSEPNSIMYSFKDLVDDDIVRIVTSDDQRVRYYYTWNRYYDGMNPTTQIVQYIVDGNSRVEVSQAQEGSFYPFIVDIKTFIDEGCIYYIVIERFKLSYSPKQVATSLSLMRLSEKGLSVVDELHLGDDFYNLADWIFVRDPDELCFDASIVGLNASSNSICLPETLHGPEWDSLNLNILSGKYSLYRISRGRFEKVNSGLVNNLNLALSDFANVELTFKTKTFVIRVDRLSEGTYRYACWKSSQSTLETPRLMLYDGIFDKRTDRYVFSNKGYYYFVGCDRVDGHHSIEVMKGDQIVLSEIRDGR